MLKYQNNKKNQLSFSGFDMNEFKMLNDEEILEGNEQESLVFKADHLKKPAKKGYKPYWPWKNLDFYTDIF